MAGTITTAPESAKDKYFFLIRRLHSLSGLFPVGVFLLFHLTANATVLGGGSKFQFMVDQIHLLEHAGLLIPVEMALIFIPLAFHAILGVAIVLTSTPNVGAYRYGPNIRYTLQRTTGVIAFVFIIFHLWQMHWLGKPFGGGFFKPDDAAGSAAAVIQAHAFWYGAIYAVGIVATVFHLANGIWTSLITWGITIGPRSQRISGYFCTAFGIALSLVGLGALKGFESFNTNAPAPDHQAQTAAVVEHAESDM